MVGRTAPIRVKHQQRFDQIKSHCGCLCCLLMGYLSVHATIEHVTEAGRRKGKGSEEHDWTIGLCAWHHFGHVGSVSSDTWRQERGPSLAHGRTAFEDYFGVEEGLVQVQNFLLDQLEVKPWPEYDVPLSIAIDARDYWMHLNGS